MLRATVLVAVLACASSFAPPSPTQLRRSTALSATPGVNRRAAVLAVAAAALSQSAGAADVPWAGTYTDPFHPNGIRKITVPCGVTGCASEATIEGSDEANGAKAWVLKGKLAGDKMVVDFRPKGGPPDLTGTYENGKINWGGNAWTKVN